MGFIHETPFDDDDDDDAGFVVGGLGFEFCLFVAGWRHALRSEWPFIIIIMMMIMQGAKLLMQTNAFYLYTPTLDDPQLSNTR